MPIERSVAIMDTIQAALSALGKVEAVEEIDLTTKLFLAQRLELEHFIVVSDLDLLAVTTIGELLALVTSGPSEPARRGNPDDDDTDDDARKY